MRLLFTSVFVSFSFLSWSQSIIDSNHVYNAEAKHLVLRLKGAIRMPDTINGLDLKNRCIGLIDTLLNDLRSDSLKYITEYDSSKMYWNMVGHQVGTRRNHIALVLTVSDCLAKDFYSISVGGLSQFRSPYGPTDKWLANGLRYYFVLDISSGKIIFYHNPMNGDTVLKLK